MRPVLCELRQYQTKPGRRDALIELFERDFIDPQEAGGLRLIGCFRDLDRPDQFVWMRGYEDAAARTPALEAFYNSDYWFARRSAVNATLVSSDNVLLLAPLSDRWAPEMDDGTPDGSAPDRGVVILGVYRLDGREDALARRFETVFAASLAEAGLPVAAALITDPAPNGFPRHPVREGEWVLVWWSVQPTAEAADAALLRSRSDPALADLFAAALQVLRLEPTARSRLQG